MACSLPHTNSEVEALVQRLINEDKVVHRDPLELAYRCEISCVSRRSRKARRNAMTGMGRLIARENTWVLSCLAPEKKELHQLRMDEEALRETLEEEAMNKKAQEE
ncbi:hypothetical protein Tco_0799088 [Tanacetum coccineum]